MGGRPSCAQCCWRMGAGCLDRRETGADETGDSRVGPVKCRLRQLDLLEAGTSLAGTGAQPGPTPAQAWAPVSYIRLVLWDRHCWYKGDWLLLSPQTFCDCDGSLWCAAQHQMRSMRVQHSLLPQRGIILILCCPKQEGEYGGEWCLIHRRLAACAL